MAIAQNNGGVESSAAEAKISSKSNGKSKEGKTTPEAPDPAAAPGLIPYSDSSDGPDEGSSDRKAEAKSPRTPKSASRDKQPTSSKSNGSGPSVNTTGIKRKHEPMTPSHNNGKPHPVSPAKPQGEAQKRRKLIDTTAKEKDHQARKAVLLKEKQLARKVADTLPVNEGKLSFLAGSLTSASDTKLVAEYSKG